MFDELAALDLLTLLPLMNITPASPSGIRCPCCQSPSIRSDGPLEIDCYAAARYIRCNGCGNEWTDIFERTAYPA